MAEELSWLEVGARIAQARKARGYSQDDLATKMDLDRTAVSKIEIGRRQVNSLELVRLSEVLERPLQWFVAAPPQAVISRRAAIAGQRSDQSSELAIEDIARDLAILVSVQALTPNEAKGSLKALKPGDGSWGAEEAALEARSLLGADSKSPLHDLADRAECVGLYAYSLVLSEAAVDGAYVEVDGIGVALINGRLDAGRRRSTLAHELGHHLFGDAYSTDWGTSGSETERAIDSFAINLLFPRAGVAQRWQDLRREHDVRTAAVIIGVEYRVSWTAALRQLKDFGLITKADYRALDARSPTRADYLECGLRVTEEVDPPHLPRGVAAAAIRAYRSYKLSGEAVEDMLRGQISLDDLPTRDEIPLAALRNELY